ncbi:uncharacterized protein LOC135209732 [Macrobrachium nipponense]|uniref:uncharacterized protein LOC135209732 n=1 Tax=Macrobrachium nipponense TaxID=159736 RepID=UPI0030C81523
MGCCCCGCKCCCILLAAVVIVVGAALGLFASLFPYPSHASCKVDWVFGESCPDVKSKLINQMHKWSSNNCDSRQQCNYEYLGEEGSTIRGLHTTQVLKFVDKFNFTLNPGYDGSCYVKGISESLTPYAVIDFGANYCNLRNLVIGSKLHSGDFAYKENSTNSVCTMYSIAHCNLYT